MRRAGAPAREEVAHRGDLDDFTHRMLELNAQRAGLGTLTPAVQPPR
ncbi:hypothetical protein [Streptomyces mirabilis]|nr:hypothetical protein [Streptomyces mirabilis]